MNKSQMMELLTKDVVPALGCTEPVCVALCAANAGLVAEGKIQNTGEPQPCVGHCFLGTHLLRLGGGGAPECTDRAF